MGRDPLAFLMNQTASHDGDRRACCLRVDGPNQQDDRAGEFARSCSIVVVLPTTQKMSPLASGGYFKECTPGGEHDNLLAD